MYWEIGRCGYKILWVEFFLRMVRFKCGFGNGGLKWGLRVFLVFWEDVWVWDGELD